MTYNTRSPAVKRLLKEAQELANPTELYHAQPLEDNLFEWHFTIRGPQDTDFAGGIYHGRILLPSDYPMKPPNIVLLTPNGRFEIHRKICLSISGYHPESWRPSWSIRTALLAIIGFMPTPGVGAVGSLELSGDERKQLALKSQSYKCDICGSIAHLLQPLTDASKAVTQEALETVPQISISGEGDGEQLIKEIPTASAEVIQNPIVSDNADSLAPPIPRTVPHSSGSPQSNAFPVINTTTTPSTTSPYGVAYWLCYPVYHPSPFMMSQPTGVADTIAGISTGTSTCTAVPTSSGQRVPLSFTEWLRQIRENRSQTATSDATTSPLSRTVLTNSATCLSHRASASFTIHQGARETVLETSITTTSCAGPCRSPAFPSVEPSARNAVLDKESNISPMGEITTTIINDKPKQSTTSCEQQKGLAKESFVLSVSDSDSYTDIQIQPRLQDSQKQSALPEPSIQPIQESNEAGKRKLTGEPPNNVFAELVEAADFKLTRSSPEGCEEATALADDATVHTPVERPLQQPETTGIHLEKKDNAVDQMEEIFQTAQDITSAPSQDLNLSSATHLSLADERAKFAHQRIDTLECHATSDSDISRNIGTPQQPPPSYESGYQLDSNEDVLETPNVLPTSFSKRGSVTEVDSHDRADELIPQEKHVDPSQTCVSSYQADSEGGVLDESKDLITSAQHPGSTTEHDVRDLVDQNAENLSQHKYADSSRKQSFSNRSESKDGSSVKQTTSSILPTDVPKFNEPHEISMEKQTQIETVEILEAPALHVTTRTAARELEHPVKSDEVVPKKRTIHINSDSDMLFYPETNTTIATEQDGFDESVEVVHRSHTTTADSRDTPVSQLLSRCGTPSERSRASELASQNFRYKAVTVCAAGVALALFLVVMRRLSLMLHGI